MQEASDMKQVLSRRAWIWRSAGGIAALLLGRGWARAQVPDDQRLASETLDFIIRCGRADGGYAPSPTQPTRVNRTRSSVTWPP